MKKVQKDFVQQLIDAGAVKLVKVAVDSSALSTVLEDTEAKWGCTKDGYFFGYKIHIACCADSELPVAISVTTGNIEQQRDCSKDSLFCFDLTYSDTCII